MADLVGKAQHRRELASAKQLKRTMMLAKKTSGYFSTYRTFTPEDSELTTLNNDENDDAIIDFNLFKHKPGEQEATHDESLSAVAGPSGIQKAVEVITINSDHEDTTSEYAPLDGNDFTLIPRSPLPQRACTVKGSPIPHWRPHLGSDADAPNPFK
jgi:hypothetical protein